jgi:hypothetical protein
LLPQDAVKRRTGIMLCDPHDIDLVEFLRGLPGVFGIIAVTSGLSWGGARIMGYRSNLSFYVSLSAVLVFLLFPGIAGLALTSSDVATWPSLYRIFCVLPVMIIFGAFPAWVMSPLFVAARLWSWRARGMAGIAPPVFILTIGVFADWWWVNSLANTC